MEGILLICIGLIGFLFYRTHGQKNQLSILQSQLYKLQQQFLQLKQSTQAQESLSQPDTVVTVEPEVEHVHAIEPVEDSAEVNEWRAEPQQQSIT